MARFGEGRFPRIGDADYDWEDLPYTPEGMEEAWGEPLAAVRYLAHLRANESQESLAGITAPEVTAAFIRAQESLSRRDFDSSPEAIARAVAAAVEAHPEQGEAGVSVSSIGWEVFGLKAGDPDLGWLGLYLDELVRCGAALRAAQHGFYSVPDEELPPARSEPLPQALSPQAVEGALRVLKQSRRELLKKMDPNKR